MERDVHGELWFRGNLHMHTTVSDGAYSPEAARALYRRAGYDFLAVTDHWDYNAGGMEDGLLVLSGAEYNVGKTVQEGVYHIVALGTEREPALRRDMTVQELVDGIRAAGGFPVLAHPAWSLNRPERIETIRGLGATEIFNSVSDFPENCRPYSGAVVDLLAADGMLLPLLATDDTHWYREVDACRSYVMVRAASCTREALLAALAAGDFYATQGPRLLIRRVGDAVVAESSPVERITFFTDATWSEHRSEVGHGITSGRYSLTEKDTVIRAEAVDQDGRTAWTNFLRL